jgi:hypothetical protein
MFLGLTFAAGIAFFISEVLIFAQEHQEHPEHPEHPQRATALQNE